MCKCTPNVRTPFCGKPGCEWPGGLPAGYRYPKPDPAPQAQEEPIGAPAPAGSVPVEGRDVSPDGTTVVRGYRTPDGVIHITGQEHVPPPQPPAPASPAGLVWTKEKPNKEGRWFKRLMINGQEQQRSIMHLNEYDVGVVGQGMNPYGGWYEWAGPIPEPAAPEAGAPGTQTRDGGGQR